MSNGRISELFTKFKKRLRFDLSGYDFESVDTKVTDAAKQTAHSIRGDQRDPAIMIHGVMPRSGTNYLSTVIELHPDVQPHPYEIYEFPFLDASIDLRNFHKKFLGFYARNREKMGEHDLLPLFGASTLVHFFNGIEEEKRMLTKVPSVRNLSHFRSVFPDEKLLILMRDGRDVVASYRKTFSAQYRWPKPSFAQVCLRWRKATDLAMAYAKHHNDDPGVLLLRYEDLVSEPTETMKKVGEKTQLDMNVFPFEEIAKLGVKGSSSLREKGAVTWNVLDKPKDFNPVGRWAGWSARQKRIFKRVAGATLIEGGWAADENW